MKSTLKIMAFLMISGGISSAATVIASNFVDINFATPILNGSQPLGNPPYVAKIGYLSAGVVLTPTTTFAQILPNWSSAGDIAFGKGDAAGYNGYFSGALNFTDAAGLAGKNIWFWITDGANFNAILENTTIQFLADAAIPSSNAVTLEMASLPDFQVKMGTFNPAGNGGTGSFVVNNAAPIPEPSAALLGALGALGLLRRRRN